MLRSHQQTIEIITATEFLMFERERYFATLRLIDQNIVHDFFCDVAVLLLRCPANRPPRHHNVLPARHVSQVGGGCCRMYKLRTYPHLKK